MPFTVTMPKLSPTMEEGTLAKWRKKEGEFVRAGEVLMEVATDKATVEHSALDAGWLQKLLIKEGETALVNQAIAIFTESQEESIEGYIPEGIIAKASPQLVSPINSEQEGCQEAATSSVSSASATGLSQPNFVPEPPLKTYIFASPSETVFASPLAKKLAKEQKIDLTTIQGSGPQGRIMSRDLALGQSSGVVTLGRRETPREIPGTYEEIPLSPMRKVIAQRLQESKTFIPHFYCTQEVLCDALIQVRGELLSGGIKLSINDFLMRAVALALRQHPEVNSGFNSTTQAIVRFKTIDLAVAVSLPAGLITPIIRHADYKNLGQLSQEMKRLAARAKQGKLVREEYMGGSFTISNLGMYGISEFVAILNPPQAAILAVGGIEERPVVKKGEVIPGHVMRLTLSADHRVIDGADAAKFLKTVQQFLENPALLIVY